MNKKIFVVIPGLNESKNISKVIHAAKKYVKTIIVVDDGSKDLTADCAEKAGAIVLKHVVNIGKGAALKTGCDYSIRTGADIIIAMDADGQHDAREIPKFIRALEGRGIVFGSRSLNKKMPFILKIGNQFINKINSFLFDIKLRDTQSGFRAFTARAYKKIRWDAQDYSVESEMVANAGREGVKYKEIKIQTIYSDNYKGTTIIDGVKIVLNMIWWRIRWA